MPFRCAFTIRSDTRYLASLRAWVRAASRLAGRRHFPAKAVMPCTLALIEAVDNAIFHAHRRRRERPIRVAIAAEDGGVVIEVADCGRGVGRHLMCDPEKMVDHGRGLFLIHRLMARVESRMRDGCHVLTMRYRNRS